MTTFSFLSGSLALENRPFHSRVAQRIRTAYTQLHGYVGYKLTTLGRASDEDVPSFMVVTQEFGILLIDVIEEKVTSAVEHDGSEYWRYESGDVGVGRSMILDIYEEEVHSRLKNDLSLYDRRTKRSKVPIRSLIIFCANEKSEIENLIDKDFHEISAIEIDQIDNWLQSVPTDYLCTTKELDRLYALIEGTFIYENKRVSIDEESLTTVNDYIQRSLQTTFKQDDAQRLAAMQLPPGPQRIRGLAGTGKTIVLCLKAAITHKRIPEFKVLYLFNTQSLYQHVQTLISKYYTLEAKKAPDFEDKLHVLHAWGGRQKPGLYSSLCRKYGLVPLTLGDVRGKGDALAFIYKDLLEKIGNSIVPEYDLILIDEAQDFPNEVFQIAFRLAKNVGTNKRIIWAYDEFQSLRDVEVKNPSELFGSNAAGEPNLPDSTLNGKYEGEIPKDFVLPNCYRTPRPVLMTAHGVAMGLYSNRPTEMFYHPADWEAIGYKVNEPQALMITSGDNVVIERPGENSKNLLEGLMLANSKNPLGLVRVENHVDDSQQLDFLKSNIKRLIETEGVAAEEIIVINLKSGNNKESMLAIQRALTSVGIQSVLPGYVESADVFKPKGFVTLTTPFRAKGNEANIVFVINAQRVAGDFTLRMRNAFFVAVTRSRGWCYICGFGSNMDKLSAEIDAIKRDFPRFKFVCPEPATVQRSKSFLNKSDKELDQIQDFIELVKKNPELKQILADQFKED